MMSTNNENYVNDVNGATFTSGTSSGRGAPRDSQVVIQRNPYGVRVLGRGARSKNKRQSPPASPSGSSTNVPATRLERRMEAAQSIRTRDNVAHSRVNHHQLLLGNWNILTLTGKELEFLEIQGEVMGRVWSSVGFQLFFGKQSILADHPPFMWQKIEYYVLHQGFWR